MSLQHPLKINEEYLWSILLETAFWIEEWCITTIPVKAHSTFKELLIRQVHEHLYMLQNIFCHQIQRTILHKLSMYHPYPFHWKYCRVNLDLSQLEWSGQSRTRLILISRNLMCNIGEEFQVACRLTVRGMF